ncbi:MAG TPA: hypothetical protein VGS41_17430, partial [Chthonomonadales bacterium]|nr:hypothetical protein [Chthonomonadales bacterium]
MAPTAAEPAGTSDGSNAAPRKRPPARASKSIAAPVEQPAAAIPEEPAGSDTTPRRRTRKPSAKKEAAPVEPLSEVAAAPAPRKRGPRKAAAKAGTAEAVEAEAAPPEEATPQPQEPAPAESVRPSRRRRGGKRSKAPALEAAPEPIEKEAPLDLTVGAHLILNLGLPEIHIHGVRYAPAIFFGNTETLENREHVAAEVKMAAAVGIHLHSTLVELPCPLAPDDTALDIAQSRLESLLAADPEGYVMPRVVFKTARGWPRENPSEMAVYGGETSGDPSIASDRFWQEAERALTRLVMRLRSTRWSGRVFAYHLEYGEWFQPVDQGYDRSVAARDAFRDWLREKYRNSIVTLRAAWFDGDAQFQTADVPAARKPTVNRAFFESRRERANIDLNEFLSDITARRLMSLARAVKKATDRQALVSVCYGYTFEFSGPASGHLALGLLESCPSIDLICGPPSYRDRNSGGAASLPSPVSSPPLYGKLWLSEDDTKTYLAAATDTDDFNPRTPDRFSTESSHSRAMGWTRAHGAGIGWMDLWGEGWLEDEGLWSKLGGYVRDYESFQQARRVARVPEVVALIDERSLLHVQRGETFHRKITAAARDALQRAGVSYGLYLQSDLTTDAFPTEAKLYLFFTP